MDLERASNLDSERTATGAVVTTKDGIANYRETTDMGYYERLDVNIRNLRARLAEGGCSRAKQDRRRYVLGCLEVKMKGHNPS